MNDLKPIDKSTLSLIIMAFNESNSLKVAAGEIYTILRQLNRPYEIIIVDDGSLDGTSGIADQLAKEFKEIRVIHHGKNKGLGYVYRTGFKYAKGDLITFFPADGQFSSTIIKQFIPLMDNYDMVLGYLCGKNRPFLSKCLSKVERILYTLLFGPIPKFQGILMFKRNLLNELELKSQGRGWVILMELIIRTQKKGYKIKSVPIESRPRMTGKSKVNNLLAVWDNLIQIFTLRCNF